MENSNSEHAQVESTAGVYVDVENLRDRARSVIKALMMSWPVVAPDPKILYLYVRADQAELWNLWANSQFPGVEVRVKGVQHFSNHQSKNSADIAMAIDSISDLLTERTGFAVLVSDDSDFIAVCAKIREETLRSTPHGGRAPFLWVITDRDGTRSATIQDYFPSEYLHVVSATDEFDDAPVSPAEPTSYLAVRSPVAEPIAPAAPVTPPEQPSPEPEPVKKAGLATDEKSNPLDAIVKTLIEYIPVGSFKSADCQKIIAEKYPNHPLARADRARFGSQFARVILPILKEKGVTEPNTRTRPRRYQMTEAAKSTRE